MCDPVTLAVASVAMTTAGGISQGNTQKRFRNAQNASDKQAAEMSKQARDAESARQDTFEANANSGYEQTRQSLGREQLDTQRADASASFVDKLASQSNATPEGFLLSGQQNASEVVKADIAKRANVAAVDSRQRIKALADLTGYGAAGQQRGQSLTDNSNFITTLNGLRRGSLGVAQQEQTVPGAQVSAGDDTLGQILMAGGQALGGYAGGGGGFGGGGAPTRPQARPTNLITG